MDIISMSNRELSRLQVINEVLNKHHKLKDAATVLDISTRQLPKSIHDIATYLVKQHYTDFGSTSADEKLASCHDVHISVETLRQWMIDAGIWTTRRAKPQRAYQPRYRRECFGELIHIDGSLYHWFENRGPRCALRVYVDGATGRLMELRFVKSESTFDYFNSTHTYLERFGKPVAFYSDKAFSASGQ